jgi:hypothetical protein
MKSPVTAYKYLLSIDKIKSIAYHTLFEKYIIQDLKADKKLEEIESTDQESLVAKLNGGFPMPGFMYTFVYKPGKELNSVNVGDKIKYYSDKVPIVFCISAHSGKFSGINLNALPNIERVKFLEMYFNEYPEFFAKLEDMTANDIIAVNKKYIEIAKSGGGQQMLKTFNAKSGANFNYGFRTYDLTKVFRLRMIEFCEWNYIPHFEPRDAFMMMNQKEIHNLYWTNK